MPIAWLLLVAAGACEIVWAVASKYSHGLTRLWPSVITIGFNVVSVLLLMLAMRRLPLGTSYAVWTGIGAAGTVLWGILFLNEPRDWPRLLCVGLIISGIIGLKLLTAAADAGS